MHFTFDLEGDEVLVDRDQLRTIVGSIGSAINNPRLRVSERRLSGLQGQLTLVLSTSAKQALLAEMAALLANLSASDLGRIAPIHTS